MIVTYIIGPGTKNYCTEAGYRNSEMGHSRAFADPAPFPLLTETGFTFKPSECLWIVPGTITP